MSRMLGQWGEGKALEYLLSQGYNPVCQNFFSKFGEIDIVATSPLGELIFVEVKTYKPNSMIHPLEAISPRKVAKLHKTARYFLSRSQLYNDIDCRFDAILVSQNGECEHIQNIF